MEELRTRRYWMYRVRDPVTGMNTPEYENGLVEFFEFVQARGFVDDVHGMRCPCRHCKNNKYHDINEVWSHLLLRGFVKDYYNWEQHGEDKIFEEYCNRPPSTVRREDYYHGEASNTEGHGQYNPFEEMISNVAGPSFVPREEEMNVDVEPNPEAQKYYDLFSSAGQPVYEGAPDGATELRSYLESLSIKTDHNLPESCYNRMCDMVQRILPGDNKFPKSWYDTKKKVADLGLGYDRYDCCEDMCMLFYSEDENLEACKFCGKSRYKLSGDKLVPKKQMFYLPLTPRIQRLYMNPSTAEHMTWHYEGEREASDVMVHPSDGEAWKEFDRKYPTFAGESRNIRLGLCSDGFTPFGQSAASYSCWPVIVTHYNLPPWMCMKSEHMFLTCVIPGPKNLKHRIDAFLQPLIDELHVLWEVGVTTWDSHRHENFKLKAALMWTINDFPAYGMLSGWSTAGRLACPLCMNKSNAFTLEHGGKPSWFDCHRCFLPEDHRWRRDKNKFYAGRTVSHKLEHPIYTGAQIYAQVYLLDRVTEQPLGRKPPNYGIDHHWQHRSIFWDLPYWKDQLLRHNLDVMHIEKNVFENLFNTIMNIEGKSKDNLKSRRDIALICKRKELELRNPGDVKAPRGSYSLDKNQKREVLEWLSGLQFPDAYVSNLKRTVDLPGLRLANYKSHDCHVFLERLMAIAFKEYLPRPLWKAVTELCTFFRDICSSSLSTGRMQHLNDNIVLTLCKLESIFPPSFFDSMEHLPVHLAYEALLGGPVQYRWMYPFERWCQSP